ncbi:hypothetical protein JBO41_09675 [Enterobacter asburiae]|nr:hypothetical protein [Enterobacter asburiae]MBL5912395.1 hypothetical protein [Enterobacter asburiae]MBL5916904.1 hypothetical protein [Enterobacter asburiae]MBL5941559.1 hypothetical protein [Enterobacter asburiae]MBL5972027.1 hypothetical protein [Enterobacter asburiae]
MQADDILSVIRWAKTQPGLEAQHTGLWGTSFGGCHVFAAAADNTDIGCIASQLACADGDAVVTGRMNPEEKAAFRATLDR